MKDALSPPIQRPLQGILWMLASGLSFVAVNGIVRALGTELPAPQSAFVRFAWGVLFLSPTLVPILRAGLPAPVWRMHLGRGVFHVAAVVCWFYAMSRIPLAEVTAIGSLNPILMTIGTVIFFGEVLAIRRIVAVAVAIIGAIIVLRPGLRELSLGHLSQVAAAVFFAGSYLYAKRMSANIPAGQVVAMLSLIVTLMLAPLAFAVWVPMTWVQVGALGIVGLAATSGHYCMSRAFGVAPVSVTQPVVFLQLVWAALLGLLVFGEPVDPFVIAGGAVIVASVSYIAWREAMLARGRKVLDAQLEA